MSNAKSSKTLRWKRVEEPANVELWFPDAMGFHPRTLESISRCKRRLPSPESAPNQAPEVDRTRQLGVDSGESSKEVQGKTRSVGKSCLLHHRTSHNMYVCPEITQGDPVLDDRRQLFFVAQSHGFHDILFQTKWYKVSDGKATASIGQDGQKVAKVRSESRRVGEFLN